MLEDLVHRAYGENAFAIMAIVSRHLPEDEKATFMEEATAGDYEQLNDVVLAWARRVDSGEF